MAAAFAPRPSIVAAGALFWPPGCRSYSCKASENRFRQPGEYPRLRKSKSRRAHFDRGERMPPDGAKEREDFVIGSSSLLRLYLEFRCKS
jgi:hypothetical protein